jgi:hypothetical protein
LTIDDFLVIFLQHADLALEEDDDLRADDEVI